MTGRVATYRVQLTPQFGFHQARGLVEYLSSLGISHFYSSPYLQAAAGSSHGYDVVDPGRINDELGGASGREQLCDALAAEGLGHIADIVPNHMAIRGGYNAWWWDVLENGPASRYSRYFDVEWNPERDDKILLPVLGDQYGVELEAGRIQLTRQGGRFFITYFEHQAPMAPRSLSSILRTAGERAQSDQLTFFADAFELLPSPNSMDDASRARRHRGKEVLLDWLARLLEESEENRREIDAVLGMINADTDELHALLEAQNYRLAYWRVGNHELAYRRFFDIDSLVGLRIEDDEVFEDTHQLITKWLLDGSADGLRIDHIDGLYNPEAYLRRLRATAPHAWLLVEKILENDEKLSASWPVEGTTGYDFLNHAQRVLTDPRGEEPLSRLHDELSLKTRSFSELLRDCKEQVLQEALDSDLERLTERISRIIQVHRRHRDTTRAELRTALKELIIAWPVYRTYVGPAEREVTEVDRSIIEHACAEARERCVDLDPRLFEFLKRFLLLEYRDEPDSVDWVMRFQQLTGPAMAKGIEDTAFYRHHRLVALNEVGGSPDRFSESLQEFHSFLAERQAMAPASLNATSSHDTKRSEDVRARLLVLSEVPDLWRRTLENLRIRLEDHKTIIDTEKPTAAPDPDTEHFLLQNLVGAWPISQERMREFALKAMREAKHFTSWHRIHEDYENAVMKYLEALYHDSGVLAEIDEFVNTIADSGYRNSLSQVLLKMLAPGVPDIYQGTELWDFSLVDPDNRRPVDFDKRKSWLSELTQSDITELWEKRFDGRLKLSITTSLLKLRARQLESLTGGYSPLEATAPSTDRVIAFRRGERVIGIATRFWQNSRDELNSLDFKLPPGAWHNIFTHQRFSQERTTVGQLLGPLPIAALELMEKPS